MAMLSACESEIDLDISPADEVVLTSFFEKGGHMMVSVYGCTPYADTTATSHLGGALLTVSINGKHLRSRSLGVDEDIVDMGIIDAEYADTVRISAEVGERKVEAQSIMLAPVSISRLDTLTTTIGYQKHLSFGLVFAEPQATTDYYQVVLTLCQTMPDGSEMRDRLNVNYSDYLFMLTAAAPLVGADIMSTGLFDDAVINGRSYRLNFSVPWGEVRSLVMPNAKSRIEVALYHHTSDYFRYITTASASQDYVLLPVFGIGSVFSNIDGGYGLFTSMVSDNHYIEIENENTNPKN